MIVTIPERKAREIARLRDAAVEAATRLSRYATANGGRFAIFGSFARGDIVHASDFDVMVEFPSRTERQARREAEAICRDLGLVPDIHLASDSSDGLKARVERDAIRLPSETRHQRPGMRDPA